VQSIVFCVSWFVTKWYDGDESVNVLSALGDDLLSEKRYDGMSYNSSSFNDYNKRRIISGARGSKKAEGLYLSEVRVWRV